MATIQAVRRCFSCGARLQTEDKDQRGFIRPEILSSYGPESVLLCEHCFAEARYNLSPRAPSVSNDMLEMVKDAKKKDGLILYVVDLFSFETSFPPELVEILKGMRMMVLGNKFDLMPEKTDKEALREYVAHRFRASSLSVNHGDVFLVGINAQTDVSDIAKEIEVRRQGKNVYIIGSSKAGKTAFRDAYLRSFNNVSHNLIVTSPYGGTSLPVMQIPLDDESFLYDSPGIELNNDIRGVLSSSLWRRIMPNKALKARKFNLSVGDGLAIEGLAMIFLTSDKKTSINLFCKEELHIAGVPTKNGTKAFMDKLRDHKFKVYDPEHCSPSDFDVFEIEVEETGERDIGIEGLGWFSFIGANQKFAIGVPKGVSIYTSRAKIGKKHAK